MTQSFDELYAPKAMTLDELFAAIRPPPVLPVQYPPPDSNVDPWARIASAANMPQPTSQDWFRGGMQSAPFNGINDSSGLGYSEISNAGRASIPNDDLLTHILARPSTGLRPLPDYSAAPQTLPPGFGRCTAGAAQRG